MLEGRGTQRTANWIIGVDRADRLSLGFAPVFVTDPEENNGSEEKVEIVPTICRSAPIPQRKA